MSSDRPEEREEPLTSWLAACNEALAGGDQSGTGGDAGITPEALAQRQRGLALLRLLRRALPPSCVGHAPHATPSGTDSQDRPGTGAGDHHPSA
jgi:hypothetical protein